MVEHTEAPIRSQEGLSSIIDGTILLSVLLNQLNFSTKLILIQSFQNEILC